MSYRKLNERGNYSRADSRYYKSPQRRQRSPVMESLHSPTEETDKMCSAKGTCSSNSGHSDQRWSRDPTQWGPHLWTYMHYAAANYPEQPNEQEIQDMIMWLCSLPVTIPCVNCQIHYKRYIEKSKPYLYRICSNRTSLFNFLVDIHNQVNQRNNKPLVSYEDARRMYYRS